MSLGDTNTIRGPFIARNTQTNSRFLLLTKLEPVYRQLKDYAG